MSKRLDYLLTAALAFGVAVAVAVYVAYSHRQALEQQRAIAAFSATITVGMSQHNAMRACEAAVDSRRAWKFRYWPQNENAGGLPVAMVESPVTFGAGNWVVYIVFDDGAVVAVLVRTLDTCREWPKGAPSDRVDDRQRPQLAGYAPD